jgi:exosortase A
MNRQQAVRPETTARAVAWRPALVAFGLLLALFLGVFWSTGLSLVATWARTGMFRYAFLIFPISAWLVWRKRDELAALYEPTVCPWALALLFGAMFTWFIGWMVNVNLLMHVAFIATFPIMVLLIFGARVFRALLFPMIYLVFAIPAGHSAVLPLQQITAAMSVQLLQWTGVPVLLQGGHFIFTPSTSWKVAEACSGIRFFTACTAIGSLFAYLFFTSYWRRAAFIVASMIVPIVANGLRVYFTILIGETFGLKYAQGTDHIVFGWQFFGTVLFLLLLVGWFLRQPPEEPETAPRGTAGRGSGLKPVLAAAVAGAVVLVAAPAWAAIDSAAVTPGTRHLIFDGAGHWTRQGNLFAKVWSPRFSGADRVIAGRYAGGGREHGSLFAARYFGAQIKDHDMLAYWNTFYDKDRWRATATRHRVIEFGDSKRWTVQEMVLRHGQSRRLVWYWYNINGLGETEPVWVRAHQAWNQLRGKSLVSSVVALSVAFPRGGKANAVADLRDFARATVPSLRQKLSNGAFR